MIFVDEFGVHLAMTRTHARAPRGERAAVCEKFERGTKLSAISALGLRGVCASMVIEGSVDQDVFDHYVESFLVPHLRAGDLVMLDNIRFHYSQRAISVIEAAGASVEHLPAYSPDFNPIEGCISKIKAILRMLKAETEQALLKALAFALDQVTASDIRGWFRHCGYST
ncbi:MAG: transposase [Pyrinomonadaceae bacterium]|nr:transposase [Pyrinomonadaceae bacterium]